MKRFWKNAIAVPGEDGWGWRIELDGRPVRTPARETLTLPTETLAAAVAAEWQDCAETVDPRAMPLTGLANAAVDRIAADPATFAAGLAQYAGSDLLCYRADHPAALVELQDRHWNPLIEWAGRRFDAHFRVTTGVAPVPQKAETLAAIGRAVTALDHFSLAGLSPLVTVSGSIVIALAVAEDSAGVDQGWAAASVDERFQMETWGEDQEAVKALSAREADFRAGARFLALLRP